jgi:hypothetical protein
MNHTRPLAALAAVTVAAGLMFAANHEDATHAASPVTHHAAHQLPACAQEDSPGPCVWDDTAGNGRGLSFVRTSSGAVHYLHPAGTLRETVRALDVCVRAAFLADDYAHTHTGARAERHAVAACAATVGGF